MAMKSKGGRMKRKDILSRVLVYSMAFCVMIFMLVVSMAYAAQPDLYLGTACNFAKSSASIGTSLMFDNNGVNSIGSADKVLPDTSVPEFGVIGAMIALIAGTAIIL